MAQLFLPHLFGAGKKNTPQTTKYGCVAMIGRAALGPVRVFTAVNFINPYKQGFCAKQINIAYDGIWFIYRQVRLCQQKR
jgi:hypothetical protein